MSISPEPPLRPSPHSTGSLRPGRVPSPRAHKHMGTATSNPEYLEGALARGVGRRAPEPARNKIRGNGYASAPNRGKTIFTASRVRARRRTRRIAAFIALAVLLVLAIFGITRLF